MDTEDWKNYALIGSRETPEEICQLMTKIAYYMASDGWMLRSGAADGADKAGQAGSEKYATDVNKPWHLFQEIYLPWNGFNGFKEDSEKGYYVINHPEVDDIAKKYHPAYEKLSSGARKLIGRNGYQVFGKKLNHPVNLIICWTSDGSYGDKTSRKTGGTGHALRIAYDHNISVYNLKNGWDYNRLTTWVAYKEFQRPVDQIDIV